METAIFEIDRTKKGGDALYELLKNSKYAKLITKRKTSVQKKEYNYNDLNDESKKAFADADARKTHKSKNANDLFNQLGI